MRIKFPIKFDGQSLARTDTFRKVSLTDRAIIERAQPYKRSNTPKLEPLAVIEQISNRDKHRVLYPFLASSEFLTVAGTELDGIDILGNYWEVTGAWEDLKVGAEFMRCKLPPHVKDEVEVAGYAAPKVLLPQGRKPIIPAMNGLISAAEDVVHDFELAYVI